MIKKEDIIMDIIKQKPDAHDIMVEEGLHCIGCGGAAFESLEQGAKAHELSDKQIKDMVTKINNLK
ncbi:MAG: DUF1858 domain-containing protein [Candidatus Woesearchaeota archaeon]